ncbi:Hypothetical Protein FCC1311_100922 [Hondaea fermentalgiana]|uniref:Uncharacterized protein n=1 Tax=Hondaea fermentalgiana TaxID=2315210 RepID=A0A2R5GU69_9STRA|nr:Hypothetical Protein FCC1311_100922 [Hondaea fermentalgiana]|eukprot:GBG33869.1 Hypothetical Protein FCC1311_100922 [Hondaea fermentalgiana]
MSLEGDTPRWEDEHADPRRGVAARLDNFDSAGSVQDRRISGRAMNMLQEDRDQACQRCEGLERALKHAQARAVAAVRQAAKLKVDLDNKFDEDAAFKAKLGTLASQEQTRHADAAEAKEKLREAEYKIQCLNKEIQRKAEALRDAKYRANARLERFASSLEATEQAALERGERLLEATRAIQSTVLDLRRHLGARGFHAVNSHTAKRLMAKICDASNKLGRAAILPGQKHAEAKLLVIGDETKTRGDSDGGSDSGSDDSSDAADDIDRALLMDSLLLDADTRPQDEGKAATSRRPRGRISKVKTKASQAALLLAAKDGTLWSGGHGNGGERDKLVRDLCKLCQDLERRNGQLAGKLEAMQLEMEAMQVRSSASALVPKYRVAIVRAKAQAHALQEKVQQQTEHLASLDEQVSSQQEYIGEMSRQRDYEQLRRQKSETKATKLEQENSRLRAQLREMEVRADRRRQFLDGLQRERGLYSGADDGGASVSSARSGMTGWRRAAQTFGEDEGGERKELQEAGLSFTQDNLGLVSNLVAQDNLGMEDVPDDLWKDERPVSAPRTPNLELKRSGTQGESLERRWWEEGEEVTEARDLFGERSVFTPDTAGTSAAFGLGSTGVGDASDRELASTLRENLDSLHREIASLQHSMG